VCSADATATGDCPAGSTADAITCACNSGFYGDGVTCTALVCSAGQYKDLAAAVCSNCAVCAADATDTGAACDGSGESDSVVCTCNEGKLPAALAARIVWEE
jgi:hypothetical protein